MGWKAGVMIVLVIALIFDVVTGFSSTMATLPVYKNNYAGMANLGQPELLFSFPEICGVFCPPPTLDPVCLDINTTKLVLTAPSNNIEVSGQIVMQIQNNTGVTLVFSVSYDKAQFNSPLGTDESITGCTTRHFDVSNQTVLTIYISAAITSFDPNGFFSSSFFGNINLGPGTYYFGEWLNLAAIGTPNNVQLVREQIGPAPPVWSGTGLLDLRAWCTTC